MTFIQRAGFKIIKEGNRVKGNFGRYSTSFYAFRAHHDLDFKPHTDIQFEPFW